VIANLSELTESTEKSESNGEATDRTHFPEMQIHREGGTPLPPGGYFGRKSFTSVVYSRVLPVKY
jgi:hypothetical protein